MADETKTEVVDVPAKFKDIVSAVESMSVLDLSELVKVLEKKFGVTATPTIVGSPTVVGASEGGEAEAEATKNVELTATGDQKIQVIKVLRDALGLGLKEAKDMTDSAPVMVKEGIDATEANELKSKLEGAGGTVTLK